MRRSIFNVDEEVAGTRDRKRIETLIEQIRKARKDHETILKKGADDPGWPDGVNANLVRNHVIYCQNKLRELCETHGWDVPPEATEEPPAQVSSQFMAPGSKSATNYVFLEEVA